jgi:hypothetical protein
MTKEVAWVKQILIISAWEFLYLLGLL